MTNRDVVSTDSYSERLHKLLPGELTAVYLAIRAQAGGNPDLYKWTLLFAILLTIVFFWLMPKLLNVSDVRTRVLYCITFVFWVVAVDGSNYFSSFNFNRNDQVTFIFCTSAAATLWSFTVPFLKR